MKVNVTRKLDALRYHSMPLLSTSFKVTKEIRVGTRSTVYKLQPLSLSLAAAVLW